MELRDNNGYTTNNIDITEEITCAICSYFYVEAVSTNCGHTFCNKCISKWKEIRNNCPTCNNPINNIYPNYTIRSIVIKYNSVHDSEHRISEVNLPNKKGISNFTPVSVIYLCDNCISNILMSPMAEIEKDLEVIINNNLDKLCVNCRRRIIIRNDDITNFSSEDEQ